MLGAVDTIRRGLCWARSREARAANAKPEAKARRVIGPVPTKERELCSIEPKVRRKVSVLRRKLQIEPLAGLLAQRQHLRVDRYPSPVDRVVMLAVFLCLQWRDRAGISPDFSFKPNAGTVGQHH